LAWGFGGALRLVFFFLAPTHVSFFLLFKFGILSLVMPAFTPITADS